MSGLLIASFFLKSSNIKHNYSASKKINIKAFHYKTLLLLFLVKGVIDLFD